MADKDEIKAVIIEKLTKAKKPALYLKDMHKWFKDDPSVKPRLIKNVANEMVRESKLMFWSSGSSTMYALPDRVKDEDKRGV
ncbi:MAG: dissimilatory sulfite reductase D family protein [Desulfobacterales bacterium]|nr:dissimilatory sulfite reductase D family protein [Desulfobacterales bacterium]